MYIHRADNVDVSVGTVQRPWVVEYVQGTVNNQRALRDYRIVGDQGTNTFRYVEGSEDADRISTKQADRSVVALERIVSVKVDGSTTHDINSASESRNVHIPEERNVLVV